MIGGGWYDAGPHHSGSVFQIEYRFSKHILHVLRPQIIFLFPELKGLYAGIGVGVDLHFGRHFICTPSFSPGYYYKGSSRDLGYPLEFRSALELSHEWSNHIRAGVQFYHLSNASLSHRNPGSNAFTFVVAIPFSFW